MIFRALALIGSVISFTLVSPLSASTVPLVACLGWQVAKWTEEAFFTFRVDRKEWVGGKLKLTSAAPPATCTGWWVVKWRQENTSLHL